MQKLVNFLTTIFGLFLIGYIWYLVPSVEKFDSMDGLIATITGMILIMFKNARMKDAIYGIIDKFAESKINNLPKK